MSYPARAEDLVNRIIKSRTLQPKISVCSRSNRVPFICIHAIFLWIRVVIVFFSWGALQLFFFFETSCNYIFSLDVCSNFIFLLRCVTILFFITETLQLYFSLSISCVELRFLLLAGSVEWSKTIKKLFGDLVWLRYDDPEFAFF